MSRKAIYYDTETTGVRPGKDRVIELAAFDAASGQEFCSFINPEMPIPAEATNISKITDAMVQDAPLIRPVLEKFVEFAPEGTILIAHNNDAFDQLFLEAEFQRAGLSMPSWVFIDSLKWARKYRPDLPRHGLQVLREAYGIQENQAHRALDDCIVLYQVFSKMVGDLSWDTILRLMKEKSEILRMPFGKHAGKRLEEVPKSYFAWLLGSGALDKNDNIPLRKTLETLGLLS